MPRQPIIAAVLTFAWASWAQVPSTWATEQAGGNSATAGALESPSRVEGKVTATPAGELPEMVVYLESVEPHRHFAPPPDPAIVSQKGAKFSPSLLITSVGQTVEFLNDEERPIEHNVFSRAPAKSFDLGLYRPGVSKSVTFDKAGVVQLYCSIHRYMDGVIFVSPTPFFARVDADGRYAIENVPAGDYHVKTWQRIRRFLEQSQRVSVPEEQSVAVDFELSRK